jgi:hypothetical protein
MNVLEIEEEKPKISPKRKCVLNALKLAIGDLPDRYDKMFLLLLGLQYFSQGAKVLVALASANLFKDHYGLDPGYVQVLNSFTMLPWSFKIFYGLISDNFPIYGSKRRSYCVILSAL